MNVFLVVCKLQYVLGDDYQVYWVDEYDAIETRTPPGLRVLQTIPENCGELSDCILSLEKDLIRTFANTYLYTYHRAITRYIESEKISEQLIRDRNAEWLNIWQSKQKMRGASIDFQEHPLNVLRWKHFMISRIYRDDSFWYSRIFDSPPPLLPKP